MIYPTNELNNIKAGCYYGQVLLNESLDVC